MNVEKVATIEDSDNVICPYCGYDYGDDSYFQDTESPHYFSGYFSGFDVECDDCKRKFFVSPNYTTTYYSFKYLDKQEPTVVE